jgi:glycosyltransferase involved in cell wall biosynthesis
MGALIDRAFRIELIVNRGNPYDDAIRANSWQNVVRVLRVNLGGITQGSVDVLGWLALFRKVRSRLLILPKGEHAQGRLIFFGLCRWKFRKIVFIEHKEAHEAPQTSGKHFFGLLPGLGLWWKRERLYRKTCALCADRIIAVCDAVKDRLVHDWRYAPGTIDVVRNGVPWRDFARSDEDGVSYRDRHGILRDAFVFGMLTRLVPFKGVDVALRALQLLVEALPERTFQLVIAGEGPDRTKLENGVRELQLQRHVVFLGYVRDRQQLLSACDVILFPSRAEGLPLALLEGMAAGCVPVVTRISGMPEAVNDPGVGWVVPPEDSRALSQAMKEALTTDAQGIARMRENAVARIRQDFDSDETSRRLVEICELLA